MFFPCWFHNYFISTIVRTYKTVGNSFIWHKFPCYHIIQIFLVCLYAKKISYIAFTCVNSLLFLFPFITFIILLPFSPNFEFNFGLDFNAMSLLHLSCKISFGFFLVRPLRIGLWNLRNIVVYWVGHWDDIGFFAFKCRSTIS